MTVAEEVALKWYELVQTNLPMCTLSAVFGPIQLSHSEQQILLRKQIPWALACGRASTLFMNIYFERYFEKDINELRRMMRISVMPKTLND